MTDLNKLAEQIEQAIPHILPANRTETPDYAQIEGPSFMMMTVQPDAVMALIDALPEVAAALRAHAAKEGAE